MTPLDWALLGFAAFFAGLVDSVVGGGGLIQLPVLLNLFPQTSIPVLFGTNKISSVFGTSSAVISFARKIRIPWRAILPATAAALVGAWLGAALAASLPREWMRPLVLVLMIGAAIYTFMHKDFGTSARRELTPADTWGLLFLGLGIGLYDGFFGPGTGSLLIFAFVRIFGMDFLRATASAKVINAATNISAIAFFANHSPLMWTTGLMMAASNLAGAIVGTRLAIKGGSAFIRKAFLLVVVILIGKLVFEMAKEW